MKLALLTLYFVFFAFTTNFPLVFSQNEQVRDTNGNAIYSGGRYYIMAGLRSGIKLGESGSSTCPVSVLLNNSEIFNSMAVTMRIDGYSVWPGTITTNTPIEIAIFEKPWCATSPKWVMVTGDNDFPGAYVGIGDARDHPGKQLITGRFYIRRYNQGLWRGNYYYYYYWFVFCYNYASLPSCFNVGIGNGGRLVLTYGAPMPIVFANTTPTL